MASNDFKVISVEDKARLKAMVPVFQKMAKQCLAGAAAASTEDGEGFVEALDAIARTLSDGYEALDRITEGFDAQK